MHSHSEDEEITTPLLSENQFNEIFEGILENLSNFSLDSIIAQCRSSLQLPIISKDHKVVSMPWVTFLLLELALKNPRASNFLLPSIPNTIFHILCNQLWKLLGNLSGSSNNLLAFLRSYLPQQIEFQVARPQSLMRWPMLLENNQDSPGYTMFVQTFKMTPTDFLDATSLLHGFSRANHFDIPMDVVRAFGPIIEKNISILMSMLGRNIVDLRMELSKSPKLPVRDALTQLPFAMRYPIINGARDNYRVWHPDIFARSMENFTHNELHLRNHDTYMRVFSSIFEDYITELAIEINPNAVTEEMWKSPRKMGHQATSVEVILPYGSTTIFIEAKMAVNKDATILVTDPDRLVSWLERVIKGVSQGREVSKRIRRNPKIYPDLAHATEEFHIVVTSRELYIGSGVRLSSILPPEVVPDNNDTLLPLNHVFIFSIDDFEYLQAAVLRGEIELPNFLRSLAIENSSIGKSSIFLVDHLRKTLRGKPLKFPQRFSKLREEVKNRVFNMLPRELAVMLKEPQKAERPGKKSRKQKSKR